MAGLSRNIATGRTRPFPRFPSPNTSPEGGNWRSGYNQGLVAAPGFANDDAVGSAILIDAAAGQTTTVLYKDLAGNNITSGAWDGGITPAEASGSADVDWWISFYMDATDNLLYILTTDRGTSPHTLHLSKIDKAGTVTAIGNTQMGNASFANQIYWEGPYFFNMRRTGGDGSGDFVVYNTYSAGNGAAAGSPYLGSKMTIAIADCSLSYANMLPAASGSVGSDPIAFGTQNYFYGGGIGPTANGMMCGLFSQPISAMGMHCPIWNINNGKQLDEAWVLPPGGEASWQASSSTFFMYWRGKILAQSYGVGYGGKTYDQGDLEHWLDEIGMYYGLL